MKTIKLQNERTTELTIALSTNKTLIALNIRENQVNEKIEIQLEKFIQRNKELTNKQSLLLL